MDSEGKAQLVADTELYYDMLNTVAYPTFTNIPSVDSFKQSCQMKPYYLRLLNLILCKIGLTQLLVLGIQMRSFWL